ncbi:hypothetical protein [uncultured Brevundimonas sp.]|uniref:hypothetical protein n=1 Tax=uncultured Brevundimonas sp. TaxID=213418 RepID=UPI0026391E71|nr:hypothetical protein [uncultured Brevundimonas sp.]
MNIEALLLSSLLVMGGQEPSIDSSKTVFIGAHPYIAKTWSAKYEYDCYGNKVSFELAVSDAVPRVSGLDLGRGQVEDRFLNELNEALSDRTYRGQGLSCRPNNRWNSLMIQTYSDISAGGIEETWVAIETTGSDVSDVIVRSN